MEKTKYFCQGNYFTYLMKYIAEEVTINDFTRDELLNSSYCIIVIEVTSKKVYSW